MSSHDEYSSDEEDYEEKQSTEVQIGFTDIPIPDENEEEDVRPEDIPTIEDTLLGGKPLWLHPESAPEEKMISCDNCNKKMAMYLQFYSPFENNLYDRVIYIFGCKNTKMCSKKKGSIKCIRGICKNPERMAQLKQEQQDEINRQMEEKLTMENKTKLRDELTKDLFKKSDTENPFGGGSNPFGNNDNPFGSNPFGEKKEEKKEENKEKKQPEKKQQQETYASITSKNLPPKPQKHHVKTSDLPSYPGYFVYLEKEKIKKVGLDPDLEKYKHLIDENAPTEDNDTNIVPEFDPLNKKGSSAASLNGANSLNKMLDDKVFENFSTVAQYNPGQILRFDIGGKPLLYQGEDEVAKAFNVKLNPQFNIPNPYYNPSSKRQFELQLMPKAIIDLEDDTNADVAAILNGMAWGTIIVCTDIEDYMPPETMDSNHVGYIEEWCGVQWEP